jgi:hypothetical protein
MLLMPCSFSVFSFVVERHGRNIVLLVDEGLHREGLRDDVDVALRQSLVREYGIERELRAGHPGCDRLALEVLDRVDAGIVVGDIGERRHLLRHADADQRQPLFAGVKNAFRTAGDAEGIGAGGNQCLDVDVRAARADRRVEAGVLVEAFCLGDVDAGELRLGDPLETDRYGFRRMGGDGTAKCGGEKCD